MVPPAEKFRLVVIAASAGGVEALCRIFSELPSTFPLAIAIVQHRSMSNPNLLAQIFQRHTQLKVKDAEDGDELHPGVVYVAPPGIHLVVDETQHLGLRDGIKVKHVRPSGDVLFASAAEAFGSQVIALVLTGGDGDGSDGIAIVKDRGGTVVSQNEASAQVSAMPRSAIATGVVDYVLDLEDIAATLVALSQRRVAWSGANDGINVARRSSMTRSDSQTAERAVILTAVDGSSVSLLAAIASARFAALPGSEIHLVHVVEAFDATTPKPAFEKARAMLERVVDESGLAGRVTLHLAAGAPWREIVQLAANLQADLIVVGTHDLNPVEKAFLGSVAEEVVKKARCPVYVARKKNHGPAAPEIEPPCPDCVTVQAETQRQKLWCARHSERHVHGHLHFQMPQGFVAGSNFFQSERQ